MKHETEREKNTTREKSASQTPNSSISDDGIASTWTTEGTKLLPEKTYHSNRLHRVTLRQKRHSSPLCHANL